MSFLTRTLVAAALAFGPITAAGVMPVAAQALVDATDPEAVVRFALKYGEAALETDSAGDPMIVGTMEGTTYTVVFYGCQANANCTTLLFRAGFAKPGFSDTDMGNWNRERLYGRAFIDAEGDPAIEHTANLFGGVSPANLDDTFDWWRVVLTQFKEHIGWQ